MNMSKDLTNSKRGSV